MRYQGICLVLTTIVVSTAFTLYSDERSVTELKHSITYADGAYARIVLMRGSFSLEELQSAYEYAQYVYTQKSTWYNSLEMQWYPFAHGTLIGAGLIGVCKLVQDAGASYKEAVEINYARQQAILTESNLAFRVTRTSLAVDAYYRHYYSALIKAAALGALTIATGYRLFYKPVLVRLQEIVSLIEKKIQEKQRAAF